MLANAGPQSIFHVSYLRGLFPEKSFRGVDMKNLDGEGRAAGGGHAPARACTGLGVNLNTIWYDVRRRRTQTPQTCTGMYPCLVLSPTVACGPFSHAVATFPVPTNTPARDHPPVTPTLNLFTLTYTDMHIKMLLPVCDESRRLVDWVEGGVYDAIKRGYCKNLFFGISTDPEGTQLLEVGSCAPCAKLGESC